MIISRTPLRISFCGGGSDLPSFYREHGGAVLSMSIARYIYLSMHAYFESAGYLLKYSKTETVGNVSEIEHPIIRQVFSDFGIRGVDFNSSADVPGGTGLGSSSAFTVGLINLCHAYLGRYKSRFELAEAACVVELEKLKEPIGKQDQFGCALGGLNFIEFHPDESVTCEAVPLSHQLRTQMENNLTMFYLGGTRSASAVLKAQAANVASSKLATDNLKSMVKQAYDLRRDICTDVDVLGPYLHEGWMRKKTLASGISNPQIDAVYDRALAAGATGGKLLGAGASGFLLLYAPSDASLEVRLALQELSAYPVKMDMQGSAIAFSD